jgi:hypothetical protein
MESSEEPVYDAKVDLCSLPVDTLIVYQTRATLSRPFSVAYTQLRAGKRTVTVAGFNREKTIEESVRITADADTLNAVVLEQTIRYRTLKYDEKADTEQDKPLVEKIQTLSEDISKVSKELEQTRHLGKRVFQDSIVSRDKYTSGKRGLEFLLAQDQLDSLENTLSDLSARSHVFDTKEADLRVQLIQLQEERKVIEKELNEIRQKRQEKRSAEQYKQQVFDITLVLDVFEQQTTDAKFQIDYAVKDCSWTPSYDLRIEKAEQTEQIQIEQPVNAEQSNKRKKLKTTRSAPVIQKSNFQQDLVDLELTCYGSINQHTGEDWCSAKEMKLCTIDPSIEAKAPTLTKQIVYFTLPPRSIGSTIRGFFSGMGFGSGKKTIEDELHQLKKANEQNLSAQEVPDAVVSNGNGSIVHHFDISGNVVDVPSDGKGHRVLLFKRKVSQCVRMHYCAPKLSQDAFVQVKCENSDVDVPLLPGSVQVFDGKNFVCNASLKRAINPRESFDLYLGVNSNVRVSYLPVKRKENTTSNMLGFSKQKHCLVERVILIKNAQQSATEITVADQLPKSVEHVIVVKLVQPESLAKALETQQPQLLEKKNGEPYLNDKNNVQWDCIQLEPGQDLRLELTYTIEWPADKNLNASDL